MTTSDSSKALNAAPGDFPRTIRRYLGNRRLLLVAAIVALVAGATLNWGWLVALGVAPTLLSLLPCLVMCGVGVCCMKMMAGSGEKPPSQSSDAAETAGSSAVVGIIAANEPSFSNAGCCHGDNGKTPPAPHLAARPSAR
jgi:hypothetical protein